MIAPLAMDRQQADHQDTLAQPKPEMIGRSFDLFVEPGDQTEIRHFRHEGAPWCRFFHDRQRDEYVGFALAEPDDLKGTHLTMNPVASRPEKGFTKRWNIARRRWLLVDFDPDRPEDSNATDEEKAAANESAHRFMEWAECWLGWPAPVIADSGNGCHLLYRVDLPADDLPPVGSTKEQDGPTTKLVKELIGLLSKLWESAREIVGVEVSSGGVKLHTGVDDSLRVELDTKVTNAAQLTKVYGTVSRKGPHSPDRPQRVTSLRHVPKRIRETPLTVGQLKAAIATLKEISGIEKKNAEPRSNGTSAHPIATSSGGGEPSPDRKRRRAEAWLRKKAPSIQRRDGSKKLKSAAIEMMVGFALPREDARQLLLSEFNPRCEPPWPESEIEHALDTTEANELVTRAAEVGWRYREQRSQRRGGRGPEGTEPRKEPKADRPEVLVTTDEHLTNDAALAALVAGDDSLYQRGGVLVHCVAEESPKGSKKELNRPAGSLTIKEVDEHNLRERLTREAKFLKPDPKKNAEPDSVVATHPPGWCVRGILSRGQWSGIRPLRGVATCPVLRQDGSVIRAPGYDSESGVILESCLDWSVPDAPTRDDVPKAVSLLTDLVGDFPFAGPEHRSGWIALVLTLLARHAIDGPCPLFLIDASRAGTGKGLLADLAGVIGLGCEMPVKSVPKEDGEMRKVITSVALAGDAAVLLDNADPQIGLGHPSLDAAITCRTWHDRLMGGNRTIKVGLNTIWAATGNNVPIKSDLLRRVQHIRLESSLEKPDLRDDFRIPNILEHARQHRVELVRACLTLLRAFIAAGRPPQTLKAWGSFGEWSDLIRGAIVFAGLPDPGVTRDELRENADTAERRFAALMDAWDTIDPTGKGVTAGAIRKAMKSNAGRESGLPEIVTEFVDAMYPLPANGHPDTDISSNSLGKALKRFLGSVAAGRRLTCRDYRNQAMWQALPVHPAATERA